MSSFLLLSLPLLHLHWHQRRTCGLCLQVWEIDSEVSLFCLLAAYGGRDALSERNEVTPGPVLFWMSTGPLGEGRVWQVLGKVRNCCCLVECWLGSPSSWPDPCLLPVGVVLWEVPHTWWLPREMWELALHVSICIVARKHQTCI